MWQNCCASTAATNKLLVQTTITKTFTRMLGWILLIIGALITATGAGHLLMGMGGSEQVIGLMIGLVSVIAGLGFKYLSNIK